MIDQERFEKAMERLANSDPVEFNLDPITTFCMVSAMQLALRHPNFKGQARGIVDNITVRLAALLANRDAELLEVLELGYCVNADQVSKAE